MLNRQQFTTVKLMATVATLAVSCITFNHINGYAQPQTSSVKLLTTEHVTAQVPLLQPLPDTVRVGLYQSFQLPHQQQLATVYQQAHTIVQNALSKAASQSTGWVVLDLDETVLDNRAYFIFNGAYQPLLWKQWIETGTAPAITGSLDFITFLRNKHIPFAFLSGRREAQRSNTLRNLTALGIPTTVPVLLKPNNFPETKTAVAFKQEHRCQLEEQSGVKILLLIGDQASDLVGDCRGIHQLKLPNPIYTVD